MIGIGGWFEVTLRRRNDLSRVVLVHGILAGRLFRRSKRGPEPPNAVELGCPQAGWACPLVCRSGFQRGFRGQDGSGLDAVQLHQFVAGGDEVPLVAGLFHLVLQNESSLLGVNLTKHALHDCLAPRLYSEAFLGLELPSHAFSQRRIRRDPSPWNIGHMFTVLDSPGRDDKPGIAVGSVRRVFA